VHEIIDVAELQLDRRPDIMNPGDLGVLPDDLDAAIELAQVIVSSFRDEQSSNISRF